MLSPGRLYDTSADPPWQSYQLEPDSNSENAFKAQESKDMGEVQSLKSKWLIKFMNLYEHLSVHMASIWTPYIWKLGRTDYLNHFKRVTRDVLPTK